MQAEPSQDPAMPLIGRALRSAALLLLLALPQYAAAEELRFGKGLLWQVAKDGQPVGQVFGTIHLADPEILALPAPVLDAFRAASSLAVEAVLDGDAVKTLGMAMALPPDRNLQDLVPADVFDLALAAAQPYGLQAVHLNRLKPWAVAMLITVPPDEILRRNAGQLPLDLWFVNEARAAGKPVHALETVMEQVDVFETLPAADQAAYLRTAAIDIAEKQRLMAAMKAAYLRRDLEAVRNATRQNMPDSDRPFAARLERGLLDTRNRHMAERMIAHFGDGNAFVAIGALHLPGDDGVLALLEQRGYTLTRKY
jgi:uncharacterized protein YbaP (TraB family)